MKMKTVSLVLAGTLALGLTTNAGAVGTAAFTDVRPGDWYYSAVNHVVERNYFNGVGADTFAPNQSMTRAMAVTVLARMFGGNLSGYTGKTAFTDVPIDAYYAKAVQWAMQKGITNGTSAITFSPDNIVTREQINALLYNAVKSTGYLGSYDSSMFDTFNDKGDVAPWASDAMKWATDKGVINGSNGLLKPKSPTTRAAFAAIAMNYDDLSGGVAPDPSGDAVSDVSIEEEINALLVDAWSTASAPERDTGKLAQAARLIASGEIKDVEQALKSVGFNKPLGIIQTDRYVSEQYDAKSFTVTSSNIQLAMDHLKSQASLMKSSSFSEYGIGVYKMNAIQFRVTVVTYKGSPRMVEETTDILISGVCRDWLTEQAAVSVSLSEIEQQVVDLTNQERVKAGLAPLAVTADMQKAAAIRAEEAAVFYSHTRPDGSNFETVYADIGSSLYYTSPLTNQKMFCAHSSGENLAGGIYTPEEVVAGWMGSDGHRKNILSAQYTHIGVALAPRFKDGVQRGYYWVQSFLSVEQQ